RSVIINKKQPGRANVTGQKTKCYLTIYQTSRNLRKFSQPRKKIYHSLAIMVNFTIIWNHPQNALGARI
ncbi:hypothetical protein, partial [Microcystis aeruginosa]|uniref:hypothetical protein n=1 Tax=Microcystis aeruginosa TaxID=1126 RepID=UPI001EE6D78E